MLVNGPIRKRRRLKIQVWKTDQVNRRLAQMMGWKYLRNFDAKKNAVSRPLILQVVSMCHCHSRCWANPDLWHGLRRMNSGGPGHWRKKLWVFGPTPPRKLWLPGSCCHQLRWLTWKVCSVASGGVRGMWVLSDAWHRGLRDRLSGLSGPIHKAKTTNLHRLERSTSGYVLPSICSMAIPVWCWRQLHSESFDLSSCQLQYDLSWDRRDECWLYRRPRLPDKLLLQLVPRGPRGPVFLFPSAG